MEIKLILPLIPLAFICETVDSSLGMGYGTTLTPLLLLLGYEPVEIVPAVLFSEFVTGILAGFFHHELGNVNLKPGTHDFKITAILTALSVVGVVIAVITSVALPSWMIKAYIGFLVLGIGLAILFYRHKHFTLSWKRIAGLGLLAAFNKGVSGGGYGPVITGGQVLSGVNIRSAVGIASLAEGITSAVGVGIYLLSGVPFPLELGPSLLLGAVLSVPLASFMVSRFLAKRMALAMGGLTTLLGGYTLVRVLF